MKQKSPSFHNQDISSSNKKWMLSLVPAVAFGAFAIVLWREPVSTPIVFNGASISSPASILPLSSTFVVGANSAAKPLILRGRLTVYNPQIIAAPAAGMVARLLVQPGQIVKAGDTIALISNQAVPAVEKSRIALQQQAVAAQEAATRQQNILQGKLAEEKVLLKAAHERVNKAAKQLADSRDLLRRLQNGEKIPSAEIDTQNDTSVAPSNPTPQKTPAPSTAALEQAQQEADQTAKAAAQKWQALHVLITRQLAAKSASANPNSNDAQPAIPTQDQIDAARADAKTAQDAADKARMKAFKLSTANSAASQSKTNIAAPAASPKSTFITQADATRIANAALKESKDALAQVDAIQRQIQRYQSPVQSATSNYQAATSNLENAQRSLFDNPPKVPMTPVIASSSGMVQTLATLATQVNPGDEIASVVAPNLLNLDVRDSSGAWKNLEVNSKFTVNVQRSADDKNPISTDARLMAITPPVRSGEPSILHIQVFNPVAKSPAPQKPKMAADAPTTQPAAPARVFAPGMIATCSIPRADATITIPRQALHVSANKQYQVAILKPQSSNATSQNYSVQWNNVLIKNDDGNSANVTVIAGLNNGDRITLQPEMLYNLSVAKGSLATVQISEK
jgi:hypothetical protein